MLKSKKKVVKLEIIKRLAEIFPQMTITDLLEYFEYCQMIKQEMGLDVTSVADRGDNR